MTSRKRTLTGTAALALVLAFLGLAFALPGSSRAASAEAQARSVAQDFFRTINAREFARTCDLLSARFYRENRIPDKAQCAWRLTLGFAWSQRFRFKIVAVRVRGGRALVRALADGAPGEVVLVREAGSFKVLALRGS